MSIGESRQLKLSVLPSNADNRTVVWSSSDASIVDVDDNGLVTAYTSGTAEITVKCNDGGFTASCTISVNNMFTASLVDTPEFAQEWSSGDAFSLFIGPGENGGKKMTVGSSGSNVEVEGDTTGISGKKLFAVYPYGDANSCDGASVTAVLGDSQVAIDSSASKKLVMSVAASTGKSLIFYHVNGFLKFTVSRSDVNEIIISGNAGEDIAGTLTIGFDEEGLPVVTNVADGKKSISVTPPGGGCFVAGKVYYCQVAPTTFKEGFTLTYATPSEDLTYRSANDIVIARAGGLYLAGKDADGVNLLKESTLMFTSTGAQILSIQTTDKNYNSCPSLQYSIDKGRTWQVLDYEASVSFGDEVAVYVKGDGDRFNKRYCYSFFATGTDAATSVSGNILSLIKGNSMYDYCFAKIFNACSISDASGLILPTELKQWCFWQMFMDCTALESAPALPATTLQTGCYQEMFRNCTCLTEAPELPAETTVQQCYMNMFRDCSSLTSIKAMFKEIKGDFAISGWLFGTAEHGTLFKPRDSKWFDLKMDYVPEGWKVEYDRKNKLSAKQLLGTWVCTEGTGILEGKKIDDDLGLFVKFTEGYDSQSLRFNSYYIESRYVTLDTDCFYFSGSNNESYTIVISFVDDKMIWEGVKNGSTTYGKDMSFCYQFERFDLSEYCGTWESVSGDHKGALITFREDGTFSSNPNDFGSGKYEICKLGEVYIKYNNGGSYCTTYTYENGKLDFGSFVLAKYDLSEICGLWECVSSSHGSFFAADANICLGCLLLIKEDGSFQSNCDLWLSGTWEITGTGRATAKTIFDTYYITSVTFWNNKIILEGNTVPQTGSSYSFKYTFGRR